MGPAILLCPSSTAVQLLGQASPSKNTRQREGILSLSNGNARHFANVHRTGDFPRRPAFFFQSAAIAGKSMENNYPFAWRRVFAAAAGGEVSVEEPAVASDAVHIEESTDTAVSTSTEETPPAEPKPQGRRNLNRSNSSNNRAVVVSPAELVPGATFPGKVTAIQPFGAFVDLGAFTNGLVHISRLSKAYVKIVEDVVQIGQDVKVQVLDVDFKANRISLMLVEEEKEEASQKEGEVGEKQPQRPPQQQGRTPRRDPSRRPGQSTAATATKMKKGEIITGTVKNMIRSGVFLILPDGTDGYLPIGEVVFRAPNTNLESQFQVGQEVTVRVLRIERGRVTLTTKQEVDYDKINEALNKDVVGGATNPFEIAFRRNELIASFLAEREKQKTEAEPEGAAKGEKEEGTAIEPVSGAASEEKTEQEEAADSVEEVKDAVEEPVEKVKAVAEEYATPSKEVSLPENPAVEEKVVASVEEVVTSNEEASPSEVSDAKDLVDEGVDALKEAAAVVEEAIVEQAGAAVEEVVNLAQEVSAKGDEVSFPEGPAIEEKVVASVEEVATSDEEASPSEVSDAKELVEEGVDALKEAVAAVEEAIVEQAGAAVEEVVNLAEEVSAKGDATVVEETVKEVIAAVEEEVLGSVEEAAPVEGSVEEPVAVEDTNQKAVAAVEEVVAEENVEEKTDTFADTEIVTPVPEAGLEGEVKETQEESEPMLAANNKEDMKQITNDNAVLHTTEVVGANIQQS